MQTSNILNIIHELTVMCSVVAELVVTVFFIWFKLFPACAGRKCKAPHQNKLSCNSLEEVHVLEYVCTHCVIQSVLHFWVTHPTEQQRCDRPLQPSLLVTWWLVHTQHLWGLRCESSHSRKADYFWSHSLWQKSDKWKHFCLRTFNFDKKEQPIQSWGTGRIKL